MKHKTIVTLVGIGGTWSKEYSFFKPKFPGEQPETAKACNQGELIRMMEDPRVLDAISMAYHVDAGRHEDDYIALLSEDP